MKTLPHKFAKLFRLYKRDGAKLLVRRIKAVIHTKTMEFQYNHLSDPVRPVYPQYRAEYQENRDYSSGHPSIKVLAFYLPQYHTFPENDHWWGKGFTEWTNVRKGIPRFDGHYQPRVPHPDFGYYCLDNPEILRKQARLAGMHGIYGFCFYYYWFSGKALMEHPLEILLRNRDIDIPFCLCWANESWTRAWDGRDDDILIKQDYSDADSASFILHISRYFSDSRYIRINGHPLIIVYNPGQIPDCRQTFSIWRREARKLGIGEIVIWTCKTHDYDASLLDIHRCIDGEIEFPPHNALLHGLQIKNIDTGDKKANIYDYRKTAAYFMNKKNGKIPSHHTFMMGWDNAARRDDNWTTYYGFSPDVLYQWVKHIVKYTEDNFGEEERFAFVNAWNEWSEGTYLEPDQKYGYAIINTVSRALLNIPINDNENGDFKK